MESTVSTSDQQSRRVDVRQKWSHEAHDFTPWLADNLNLLGAELGLSLELVAREKPVGPYYLDILAKTGTEELVAIENQLEWTDFGDAWVTLYIRPTDTDLTKYMFESHLTVDPAPEAEILDTRARQDQELESSPVDGDGVTA